MIYNLEKDLRFLIGEFSRMADEYQDKAKNMDNEFFQAYYTGRAGAYSVCRDLLKEVIDDA